MNLRKIIHPQVRDNYRVILEGDDGDFEIGSIGIQHAAGSGYFRAWGIDTVIPMRARLLIPDVSAGARRQSSCGRGMSAIPPLSGDK